MSHPFHMTLTDAQYAFLRAESARTDVPMAELARRAIDATYRPKLRRKLRGYELSVVLSREPDAATVGRTAAPRVPGRPLYAREM